MFCLTAGVHSEGNVGLQSEMYQLSSSPDEFVIKQRGRRHTFHPICLSFANLSDNDNGMEILLEPWFVAVRLVFWIAKCNFVHDFAYNAGRMLRDI